MRRKSNKKERDSKSNKYEENWESKKKNTCGKKELRTFQRNKNKGNVEVRGRGKVHVQNQGKRREETGEVREKE